MELLRRFDRGRGIDGEMRKQLLADLEKFPGTFRIYASQTGSTCEQFFVEFRTNDTTAANKFLERMENMQNVLT